MKRKIDFHTMYNKKDQNTKLSDKFILHKLWKEKCFHITIKINVNSMKYKNIFQASSSIIIQVYIIRICKGVPKMSAAPC